MTPEPRHPTLTVAVMMAAAGLVFAAVTCVTAALPEIGRSLDATQTELHLVADLFPVMIGGLVLPAGNLLDRYGRRRVMLLGSLALYALNPAQGAAPASPPAHLPGQLTDH